VTVSLITYDNSRIFDSDAADSRADFNGSTVTMISEQWILVH